MHPSLGTFQDKPIYKVLSYILDSVSEDGSWGTADFEDWAPIITVLTVDLLLSVGIDPNMKWIVDRGVQTFECSLSLSIHQYIDNNIREDGSFGEDFWDACKLGALLNKYSFHDRFTRSEKLGRYIIDAVERDEYRAKDKTWCGPGYYAAAVDYLDGIGKTDLATTIYNELVACQCHDGSFRGPVGIDGNEVVHPVWHTSQALITFLRRQVSEKDQKILKILEWIKSAQDDSGCFKAFSRYGIYYTAYAVLGLSALSNPPLDILQKSIDWLVSNISPTGKVADGGGTLMTALALRAVEKSDLSFQVSIVELRRLTTLEGRCKVLENDNAKLKEHNNRLTADIGEYREKYKNADFVLTKADVFKFSIMIAVLVLVLGIIVPLLITRCSPGTEKEKKIEQTIPQIPTPIQPPSKSRPEIPKK